MPNTLSELTIAYSIVWVVLFILIVKMGRDITKLESKLSSTQLNSPNDQK